MFNDRMPTKEAVKKWKNDIDNKVTLKDQPIPCILLANKVHKAARHTTPAVPQRADAALRCVCVFFALLHSCVWCKSVPTVRFKP